MSAHEKATPGPWRVVAGDDYMVVSDATPEQYPHRCRGDDLGRFVALVGNRGADLGEHDAALIVEAVNSFEALTAERDALKAENERLHADREAVWYWIRHPDWTDEFSQRDLLKWLDKRPSHLTRPLREETVEREKTARAAIKW